MNEKKLLTQIQAVSLMAVDLHLFLDTHPNDTEALKDY
ncbi:MAG: spore coat protein CotJB, partial [Turicibacter sp.]|nr:spore coat protein CotJB [Turicibacter sp.]